MYAIRDERIRQSMSQKRLAHEAGITVRTLRKIEKGEDVSLETYRSVCKALGLRPIQANEPCNIPADAAGTATAIEYSSAIPAIKTAARFKLVAEITHIPLILISCYAVGFGLYHYFFGKLSPIFLIAQFLMPTAAAFLLAWVHKKYWLKRDLLWTGLFSGSTWRTPAGEVGKCDICNDGKYLSLSFDGGASRQKYPISVLQAVSNPELFDCSRDGSLQPISVFQLNGLVIAVLIATFGAVFLESKMPSLIPEWSFYFTVVSGLGIALNCVGTYLNFNESDLPTEHVVKYSKTQWRTISGEVGTVRWVDHHHDNTSGFSTDTIVLRLPNGNIERHDKSDLTPAHLIAA